MFLVNSLIFVVSIGALIFISHVSCLLSPLINRTKFAPRASLVREMMLDQCSLHANQIPPISGSVDVGIGMSGITFGGIDDLEQTFNVIAVLRVQWQNPCTIWNDYDDWSQVGLFSEKIEDVWTPPLLHINGIDKILIPRVFRGYPVAFFNDGTTFYSGIAAFTSSCELALKKFPFDMEACSVQVEPLYNTNGISLELPVSLSQAPDADAFMNKGDIWEFVDFQATISNTTYPGDEHTFHRAIFMFTFQRRYRFYVISVFLPTFCLIIMKIFCGFLPPDETDRAMFCATLVLSYAVMVSLITDLTPLSAEIPYISIFLGYNLGTSLLCTLYSIITCGLARKKQFRKTIKEIHGFALRHPLSIIRIFDIIFYGIISLAAIVADCILFTLMAVPENPMEDLLKTWTASGNDKTQA